MTRGALHAFVCAGRVAAAVVGGVRPATAGASNPAPVPVPAAAHPSPPRIRATARKPKPPPSAPRAKATLHVTPGALGTPWTFELTNDDTTPLRLVTDGRLLTLDVTPDADAAARGATKAGHGKVRCALPDDMRPATDGDKARVIAPGVTYVEEFDPRLYCFDGREAAALSPGATLVAHLGWTAPGAGAIAPPFVADATLDGDARAGVKEVTADAVTVPETLPSDDPAPRRAPVVVRAPARVDAAVGRELVFDVSVENTTSRAVRLMLRPETLAFEVASPKGVSSCEWKRRAGAPIAEVFTDVPPHAKASTNVLPATLCPDATFQSAGLYTLRTRLDARHASGK